MKWEAKQIKRRRRRRRVCWWWRWSPSTAVCCHHGRFELRPGDHRLQPRRPSVSGGICPGGRQEGLHGGEFILKLVWEDKKLLLPRPQALEEECWAAGRQRGLTCAARKFWAECQGLTVACTESEPCAAASLPWIYFAKTLLLPQSEDFGQLSLPQIVFNPPPGWRADLNKYNWILHNLTSYKGNLHPLDPSP